MQVLQIRRGKAYERLLGRGMRGESGRPDLNRRPLEPHSSALPGCATPRMHLIIAQRG